MLSTLKPTRLAVLTLTGALALAACEDTNDPEPEPEIVTMRLTVATPAAQTIDVGGTTGCQVTGGPITLPRNTTVAISASFLRANGTPDPIANDPDIFRLSGSDNPSGAEPSPTPATITWARTGNFAGTLRGTVATTSGSVQFSAFHIEEGHEDFGPCTVPITVSP